MDTKVVVDGDDDEKGAEDKAGKRTLSDLVDTTSDNGEKSVSNCDGNAEEEVLEEDQMIPAKRRRIEGEDLKSFLDSSLCVTTTLIPAAAMSSHPLPSSVASITPNPKRSRKDAILQPRANQELVNVVHATASNNPLSQERSTFMDRLSTFQPLMWSSFNPVSPLECARFGWALAGLDLVKCVSCGAVLLGKLASASDPFVFQRSVAALRAKLVSAHARFCKWPALPAPESFFDLQVVDSPPMTLVESVRAMTFRFGSFLPRFTPRTQSRIADGKIIQWLCGLAKGPDQESETLRSAVILALTGWTVKGSERVPVISCAVCNKNCGAWTYQTTVDPVSSSSTEDEQEIFPDESDLILQETIADVVEMAVRDVAEEAVASVGEEKQKEAAVVNASDLVDNSRSLGDAGPLTFRNVSGGDMTFRPSAESQDDYAKVGDEAERDPHKDEEVMISNDFTQEEEGKRLEGNEVKGAEEFLNFDEAIEQQALPAESSSGEGLEIESDDVDGSENDRRDIDEFEDEDDVSVSEEENISPIDSSAVEEDTEDVQELDTSAEVRNESLQEEEDKDHVNQMEGEENNEEEEDVASVSNEEEEEDIDQDAETEEEEEEQDVEEEEEEEINHEAETEGEEDADKEEEEEEEEEEIGGDFEEEGVDRSSDFESSASSAECADDGKDSDSDIVILSSDDEEEQPRGDDAGDGRDDPESLEVSGMSTYDNEEVFANEDARVSSSSQDHERPSHCEGNANDDESVPNLDGMFDLEDSSLRKPFFHPLDNHLPWCSWIRKSQADPDKSGWMMVLKRLQEIQAASSAAVSGREVDGSGPKVAASPEQSLYRIRNLLDM